MRKNFLCNLIRLLCLGTLILSNKTYAQTEVEAWGNLKGIRIDGQLMDIQSSIDVIGLNSSKIFSTAKEQQHPNFDRQGNRQIINTNIDSFYFVETFDDVSKGVSKISVQFTSKKDTTIDGLYFDLKLPPNIYNKGNIVDENNAASNFSIDKKNNFLINTSAVKFTSPQQQTAIDFDQSTSLQIKKDDEFIHLFIPIQTGKFTDGETASITFTIKASGTIDRSPATVQLNVNNTGRMFAGFGGNFRLQNPKADPQVINYCLNNMRVAYARVEMPWMLWQPDENSNPIDSAKAGKLHPHVKESMQMAQRLSKMNIPVILTAWFPPKWAVVGELHFRHQPGGEWGNPIDSTRAQEVYKSITDYILYLKDAYGVDVKLFSFNESDLGINIRQTAEEHATLIKGLGAYFASHGVQTKMLLGDNSDATTFNFILPAMNDAATHPYIGAISFHSWRGCTSEILKKWNDAATKMHLPLIVGEGSIDAAAWAYPKIFEEQSYALEEIGLYIKLLNECQPLSILQWQLTSDYSPLKGGGIFGDDDPLQPTQRFWNLKQLASIPPNVYAIHATIDNNHIVCAAQISADKKIVVVHLVNNGAERIATIKGLPASIKKLSLYTTSKTKNMEEKTAAVVNGQVKIKLEAVSYTTVIAK
ncbi:MAG TPA: hypothetical protein VHB70_05320 [Parafilimonas sp.]|nr:hypothetical protein [Parafilimonas sp.]